jgi:hypothetical protein
MTKYNMFHNGVKLNTSSLTNEQAIEYQNECIRNYGYRPLMTPIKELVDVECPVCNRSANVRKDFDFPKTMLCCDDCGADFTTDLEIILNPKNN